MARGTIICNKKLTPARLEGTFIAMQEFRTGRTLLIALAVCAPAGLTAQAADTPVDSALASWLGARGLAPDWVELVDTGTGGDLEALILSVKDGDGEEYWTVSRPAGAPHAIRRVGTIPAHWIDLSIEAVAGRSIYLRKIGGYGIAFLQQYHLAEDGSVNERELSTPRPGPIAVHGDSVYAAWDLGRDGQLAVAVSRADTGATAYHFGVEQAIETIRLQDGKVAFVTGGRAIIRHPGGGWGGYRLRSPPYDPPGVRLLDPSVPQFRVVPGGLAEVRLRDTLFIPLDYPDFEHFRRARPDHLVGVSPEHIDLSVDIGPVTDDGDRIWFGLTFYDGEGFDGVGGFGWFDPSTREAELLYPPEMADYSVSAISIEEGKLLLGLVIRPEGATMGLGLARYDPASGVFERLLDEGHITGIATAGDRIFAVSDQGLLEVDSHDHAVKRWQVFPQGRSGEAPPIAFRRGLRGR